MALSVSKTGNYFVYVGCQERHGIVNPRHFDLGPDRAAAKRRAKKLWQLWETQGALWTEEGLLQAREILRST